MKTFEPPLFPYEWKLADGYNIMPHHGRTVFSTFACGGGSTMGYKLAGYTVLGCEEIDPKMMTVYQANHHPKYAFLEGIKEFKDRTDIPDELFDLDILDGSPPCSTFSMAGNREKDWGKEKHFAEGQCAQVLDTLFFDFIDLAKRLQPKVVVAENVKGLLIGEAKKYVQRIIKEFEEAGYQTEYWLLNSGDMGVPQNRWRVFFISLRDDLCNKIPGIKQTLFSKMPALNLDFNNKPVIYADFADRTGKPITDFKKKAWEFRKMGDTSLWESKVRGGLPPTQFNVVYVYDGRPLPTITAHGLGSLILYEKPIHVSPREVILGSTFPTDYDFGIFNDPSYLCGMSVPPVMVANIAYRIERQWLCHL